MKILNFGSLNYDYVYSVDHILLPGETSAAWRMETFVGGKGLNQSVALARAGAEVWHAGQVGEEGEELLHLCRENGVHTEYIRRVPGKSGHTVIQVDKKGQNNILLFGGANRSIPEDYADEVLAAFGEGDLLLLQNEINGIPRLIDRAYARGMRIVLNPSPYDEVIGECDLSKVSVLLINEIEGWQISGQREPDAILDDLVKTHPELAVVLTLGSQGVVYRHKDEHFSHGVYSVPVVDTTAAGDTFTGYFLAAITRGGSVPQALELASKASSIAVTRRGAAPSIPLLREVQSYAF
ncbi:ribokinase [Faecalispora anaeroviscerum]|uniref:ribokinase n=1 Tax=Faecalispora anaeroviscerum TaxID=2991836 RepID=UPI0024BB6A8E|nr:ribokinase [Faecalispora anaeroviscerum]